MRRLYAGFFVAVLAWNCSSSDPDTGSTKGTSTSSSTSSSGTGGSSSSSSGSSSGDASTGAKPATPTVMSAEKLAGGLHVMWMVNDTGLSGVDLLRKVNTGAYAKLVSLPGTATSYHDASASVATSTYCFKVQTTKSGQTSDLSNEICGSP